MRNLNINSLKFIAITIGICFIFALVVLHAYVYLPKYTKENSNIESPVLSETRDAEYSEAEMDSNRSLEDSSNEEYIEEYAEGGQTTETSDSQSPILEVIPDEHLVEGNITDSAQKTSKEDEISKFLDKASEERKNQQYASAIFTYEKVLSLADDVKTKAFCYEQIANLYAIQKRYGSALSFAQKAFNAEPNMNREFLLARLYYKTGDMDKSTTRIDNILKRDFGVND